MTTETKCPRCDGCAGSDHHWMDDNLGEESPWPFYGCKHCEAIGCDCPQCGGPDNEDACSTCLECEASGIVIATMYRIVLGEHSTLMAMPDEAKAREEFGRLYGADGSSATVKAVAKVGNCEGCLRDVFETEDYKADRGRDGDGKWCPECAAEMGGEGG